MRISDWSSDVCSSDLVAGMAEDHRQPAVAPVGADGAQQALQSVGVVRVVDVHVQRAETPVLQAAGVVVVAAAEARQGCGDYRYRDIHRGGRQRGGGRSEEHTSELQSLMRTSYAVFCLKKKKQKHNMTESTNRRERDKEQN